LLLLRIGFGEALVLADGAIEILLIFEVAAELQPELRRGFVPARVQKLLIVLPGGFGVLRLELKLAELHEGVAVSGEIALAPVDL
jgi:hypothetical protein